jgi:hypothetical protein
MFCQPCSAGSSSPPPRASIRCAHDSCTYAVHPDPAICENSCCKKCAAQLEQGGEPQHGRRCFMSFPTAGSATCQRSEVTSQAAASLRTAHGEEGMVGLLTQPSNPECNESNTRGANMMTIGKVCEQGLCDLGLCGKRIKHENMQVRREGKATCIDCFNVKYAEKESPGHGATGHTQKNSSSVCPMKSTWR